MYHTMTPMPFEAIAGIIDLTASNYASCKSITLLQIGWLTLYYLKKKDYHAFRKVIETQSIDVVLCDHISFACIHAAKETKRPVIITMMINESPGTHT